MLYAALADAVLILHLGFILLVACGGVLVLFRPWFTLVHLPAVCWGATCRSPARSVRLRRSSNSGVSRPASGDMTAGSSIITSWP